MNRLLALYARNKGVGQGWNIQQKAAGEEATIYLYDAIVSTQADAEWFGGVSAEAFVPAVRAIKAPVIHVRINSPGGDVFAGRAMERALRDTSAQVIVHVDGVAASAASVVAMAGDEVRMAAGSMMMVHRAWTMGWGNANDLIETAALLEKIDAQLARTYAQRTGSTDEAMLSLMDAETWMTPEEAVAARFATSVIEDAPRASAAWDLSAYAHAPQPHAPATTQPEPSPTAPANSGVPEHLLALAKLRAIQGRVQFTRSN